MRQISPDLLAHLETRATTLCHCWKVVPQRGAALGFTDHDNDVMFDGVTFEAQAGFTATEIEQSLGFSVDNLDASGALRSEHLSETRIEGGDFDHAEVEIWRVNWQDVSQRYLLRKGHVGEITRGAAAFTAEIRGLTALLDQPKGRVFMAACDAVVGDAKCGVAIAAAAFKGSGIVSTVDGTRLTVSGLGPFESGWFSRGLLTWVSGANVGRRADVKAHAAGPPTVIELWQPAAAPAEVGDGFTLTAGCDKCFETCRTKFNNATNFRGFPHMPGDDFVLGYAVHDDPANTGASLFQ